MRLATGLSNSPERGADSRPVPGRGSGRVGPMLRPQIRNIGLEAAKTAGLVFAPHAAFPDFPRGAKPAFSGLDVPRGNACEPASRLNKSGSPRGGKRGGGNPRPRGKPCRYYALPLVDSACAWEYATTCAGGGAMTPGKCSGLVGKLTCGSESWEPAKQLRRWSRVGNPARHALFVAGIGAVCRAPEEKGGLLSMRRVRHRSDARRGPSDPMRAGRRPWSPTVPSPPMVGSAHSPDLDWKRYREERDAQECDRQRATQAGPGASVGEVRGWDGSLDVRRGALSHGK